MNNIILILSILLISISYSQVTPPPYITPSEPYERSNAGIWSSAWISAQPQFNTPPGYFVCQVSIRQMIWKKQVQDCGCPKCTWCQRTYYTMINGLKVRFCHYDDWNNQIEKTFQTTSNNSGVYRDYKCPRNTYVTSASSKFGFSTQTDLGWNGFQMTCEGLNLNQTSTLIQDPSTGWNSPFTKPTYGTFLSAILVKYEVGGKFTGVNFGYSGVPVISKISLEYAQTSYTSMQVPYGTTLVQNNGTLPISENRQIQKSVLTQNIFTNQLAHTHNFKIKSNVIIDQQQIVDGYLIPDEKRQLVPSNFSFNNLIQTKKQIRQNLCIQIGSCKSIQILTIVNLQKAKTVYTVALTFVNRLTGQYIGVTSKIKGVWTGTLVQSVKTKTTQSTLADCGSTANLTTQ